MKRLTWIFAPGLMVLLLASAVYSMPMTYSGRLDIGEMMAIADSTFDLAQEDAVVLLEGRRETVLPDGRRSLLIHQIVYITTDYGIETYADLRIPYDEQRQTLEVQSLRTWRISDQRWIDHRKTAIVPTTPTALAESPAYSNIRETMLLHDGVELPCILETAYVIEDREPYRLGVEGQYIFTHEEPTIWSWLVLEFPSTVQPNIVSSGGAPEGERSRDAATGLERWSFRMGPLDPRPDPELADPASYLPHVSWTTWDGWQRYSDHLEKRFRDAMVLDGDLKSMLHAGVDELTSPLEKARWVETFVNESVRYVNYDDSYFWEAPGQANATYQHAYGCGLDRAVLTAALAEEAGLMVWPIFRGKGFVHVDEGVATLARLEPVSLWISGEDVEAFYNPRAGKLETGLSPVLGKTVWFLGRGNAPEMRGVTEDELSRYEITLSLTWNDGQSQYAGDGHFTGYWALNPHNKMSVEGDKGRDQLEKVASSVVEGAQVGGYSSTTYDEFTIATGFEVTAPLAKKDNLGRIRVVLGDPADGLWSWMPSDVHLYSSERGSPVQLQSSAQQTVEVQFNDSERQLVRLPEPVKLENKAGRFELAVEQEEGSVTVRRTLRLSKRTYDASEWPQLRELLVADKDEANRVILFK